MDLQLKGKVAIVCAASRGLGKGAALALAQEGVNLVICARNQETLMVTAEDIQQQTGVCVYPVVCDLNDKSSSDKLINTAIENFQRLDILITNVAHPKTGSFFSLSEQDWQLGYDNILLPVVRLCRLAIPYMKENQWGRIIHIGSYAIKEPNMTYLLSAVFRTGIVVLSKALAEEFGRDGIRVNTVCPGLFHTELGHDILQKIAQKQNLSVAEATEKMASYTVTGELGQVNELAGLIAFLSSDFANHITGQMIMVEGGKARGLF